MTQSISHGSCDFAQDDEKGAPDMTERLGCPTRRLGYAQHDGGTAYSTPSVIMPPVTPRTATTTSVIPRTAGPRHPARSEAESQDPTQ